MKDKRGFTLIEVILAMALFSFMLMIVTSGYLEIMALYQAGLASRNTEQNARYGIDQIESDGRSASSVLVGVGSTPNTSVLCFVGVSNPVQFYVDSNGRLRTAVMPATMPTSPPPLTSTSTCGNTPASVFTSDPQLADEVHDDRAISSSDVFVTKFSATPEDQDAFGIYHSVDLDIEFASQQTGLVSIFGTDNQCDPTQSGLQFCSVVRIHTSVSLRGE